MAVETPVVVPVPPAPAFEAFPIARFQSRMADRLLDRRAGQFVVGRRIEHAQALRLKEGAFGDLTLETFAALAPCFLLDG